MYQTVRIRREFDEKMRASNTVDLREYAPTLHSVARDDPYTPEELSAIALADGGIEVSPKGVCIDPWPQDTPQWQDHLEALARERDAGASTESKK